MRTLTEAPTDSQLAFEDLANASWLGEAEIFEWETPSRRSRHTKSNHTTESDLMSFSLRAALLSPIGREDSPGIRRRGNDNVPSPSQAKKTLFQKAQDEIAKDANLAWARENHVLAIDNSAGPQQYIPVAPGDADSEKLNATAGYESVLQLRIPETDSGRRLDKCFQALHKRWKHLADVYFLILFQTPQLPGVLLYKWQHRQVADQQAPSPPHSTYSTQSHNEPSEPSPPPQLEFEDQQSSQHDQQEHVQYLQGEAQIQEDSPLDPPPAIHHPHDENMLPVPPPASDTSMEEIPLPPSPAPTASHTEPKEKKRPGLTCGETPSKKRLTTSNDIPLTPQSPMSRARSELEEIERQLEHLEAERVAKQKLIEQLEAQKRKRQDSGYDADVSASKPRLVLKSNHRRRSKGKRQDDVPLSAPHTSGRERAVSHQSDLNTQSKNTAAITPATRAMRPQHSALTATVSVPPITSFREALTSRNTITENQVHHPSAFLNNNSSSLMNSNSLLLEFADAASFTSQNVRLLPPWEDSN